ncbi:MAG TPA: ABC transporter permease [Phycisphaerales bacterium]|nr:ABC transporter permease [Phycisphaerales bacterium]|tara:strand:- start:3962 stop:5155 length:1194 start_codon:yes stop_codon:yes gene_type:complete
MTTLNTPQSIINKQPRSFLAGVLLDMCGRWGARVGLAWIGLVAFFAVFGPLVASSHPILWKTEDGLSSPMLEHLMPADVILLAMTFVAAVLLVCKWIHFGKRVLWFFAIGIVVSILSLVFIKPPQAIVYSQYREALTTEKADWAVMTIVPYSPTDRFREMEETRFLSPTSKHWMGTTGDGEDLCSRMIHACRIALAVGFLSTGIAIFIGVFIGGLMGYFSGWVDLLGMRLVEVFSSIPTIFLLITFVAFYGRNLYLMMIILGLTGWVGYAVFTRAEFLKLREQDFVQAAIACGLPLRSVLFKHMLPNGVTPVLVSASFGVAGAILTESTLSFLGLGLVDEPSWGQMLNQARGQGGVFTWWMAIYPGMAIFLTVFAYNLVGEALRDAIDPQLKKAAQL